MLQRMLAGVVTVLLVASCAHSPTLGETEVRQGRITRIDEVSLEGDHQLGLGAIVGGIAGIEAAIKLAHPEIKTLFVRPETVESWRNRRAKLVGVNPQP